MGRRGSRGFFKALNLRRKPKQLTLTVLLMLLTISMALALPSTNTTKAITIDPSTNLSQASSKANETNYWSKTYGGTKNDGGNWVEQTSDGGYIITGYTESYGPGGWDIWLIKTDVNGDLVWNQTFGGPKGDSGFCVRQTIDGGYIITGHIDVYACLIKTDKNGNEEWKKTFGESSWNPGWSVKETTDGGYIITGFTGYYPYYDILLVKTNANGNEEWRQTYGGTEGDSAYSVLQTSDEGYLISGRTESFGSGSRGNIWLIKTDSSGIMQWNTTLGEGSGNCVEQTIDGGYIITGYTFTYTYTNSTTIDVCLIKTNSTGNIEWKQSYGESGDDRGYCVEQTSDGGYILTGFTKGYNIWLIKANSTGDLEWSQTYGGSSFDYGYCIKQTTDQGYILTGFTETYGFAGEEDVWLIKTDENGITETPTPPENPPSDNPPFNDIVTKYSSDFYEILFVIFILFLAYFFFVIRERVKIGIEEKALYALPCPNCGAVVEMGATSCKNCLIEFQTCGVCKLSILDDLVKTPCCESYAHRSHLKEWLKIKGKCPNCREKLEEWDII